MYIRYRYVYIFLWFLKNFYFFRTWLGSRASWSTEGATPKCWNKAAFLLSHIILLYVLCTCFNLITLRNYSFKVGLPPNIRHKPDKLPLSTSCFDWKPWCLSVSVTLSLPSHFLQSIPQQHQSKHFGFCISRLSGQP